MGLWLREIGGQQVLRIGVSAVDRASAAGVANFPAVVEAHPMSRLLAIIDAYRDAHGHPSEASVARAIGLSPQAISSWRARGFKRPPDPDAMRKLAVLVGLDYETVILPAALMDARWMEDKGDDDGTLATNTAG